MKLRDLHLPNKTVVLVAGNRLLAAVFAASTTLMMARLYGPGVASQYFSALALSALVSVVCRWGMMQAVVRVVAQEPEAYSRRRFAGAFLTLAAVAAVVSMVVMFAVVQLVLENVGVASKVAASTIVAVEIMRLFTTELLRAFDRVDLAVIGGEAGRNLAFMILVLSTSGVMTRLDELLILYLLSTTMVVIPGMLAVRKVVRPIAQSVHSSISLLRASSRTMSDILATDLAQVWILQAPIIIGARYLDETAAVQVAVSMRTTQLILMPLVTLVQYSSPKLAVLGLDTGSTEPLRRIAGYAAAASTGIFGVLALYVGLDQGDELVLPSFLPIGLGLLISVFCGPTHAAMNLVGYAGQNARILLAGASVTAVVGFVSASVLSSSVLLSLTFGLTIASVHCAQLSFLRFKGIVVWPLLGMPRRIDIETVLPFK